VLVCRLIEKADCV